jgi:hypothetical protein
MWSQESALGRDLPESAFSFLTSKLLWGVGELRGNMSEIYFLVSAARSLETRYHKLAWQLNQKVQWKKLYAILDMGKSNAGHRPAGWAMVSVPERRLALHREPHASLQTA